MTEGYWVEKGSDDDLYAAGIASLEENYIANPTNPWSITANKLYDEGLGSAETRSQIFKDRVDYLEVICQLILDQLEQELDPTIPENRILRNILNGFRQI